MTITEETAKRIADELERLVEILEAQRPIAPVVPTPPSYPSPYWGTDAAPCYLCHVYHRGPCPHARKAFP